MTVMTSDVATRYR